jgi:hypothetical protein
MTYTVEISGWSGSQWLRITADSEAAARAIAGRKIWPRKGEYIKDLTTITKEQTA